MPYDGFVVSSIVSELNEKIMNGKVDKIYQPEKDELIINVRTYTESHKLLFSSSPTYPRVCLTTASRNNPQVPPSFCMLLRKHLTGGRIVNIEQPDMERIIIITFECFDELGYSTRKALIAEIMGRHSNIIFIDRDSNKIIDSIKRVDFEVSSVREVLPGRIYTLPPSGDKVSPLSVDKTSFLKGIELSPASVKADKYLLKAYNGVSPVLAREICNRAHIDPDKDIKYFSDAEANGLFDSFSSITDNVRSSSYTPVIVSKEGQLSDFSCFELTVYGGYEFKHYKSMSEVVEIFYSEKDRKDRLKQKSGDVYKIISNKLDRCFKKLEILNSELDQAQNSEQYKVYGDLLTSNLHLLQKGQSSASLTNYYSESCENIDIPLDIQLTPVANAQRYYKQYNKSKTAIRLINRQLQENKLEIDYLEAQLDNLEKCTEEIEINEIRNELAEQGYIKVKKYGKSKPVKASKPLHFISTKGFDLYVGKNNVQNDLLTLKFAVSNDIWLHTKEIPGSHVIIRTNGANVDDLTLEEAANLAAFYSKAKMSSKVPVDYTFKKNVKKPNGAKPGMVIYESNKTIYITPDEGRIKMLKQEQ